MFQAERRKKKENFLLRKQHKTLLDSCAKRLTNVLICVCSIIQCVFISAYSTFSLTRSFSSPLQFHCPSFINSLISRTDLDAWSIESGGNITPPGARKIPISIYHFMTQIDYRAHATASLRSSSHVQLIKYIIFIHPVPLLPLCGRRRLLLLLHTYSSKTRGTDIHSVKGNRVQLGALIE